ncbi:MAG TPA: LysR family transcriptional regulator [Firmicutes bacterium]|nr:LysR family transcriptional regulator [Bacillota bacterium]
MSIRHLRIFIMVATYNNMSIAAEKLFITQPSVSQAIKEIEAYYGIQLFERLSKKLYLTEAGEFLLNYAVHIVQSFDELELALKNKGQHLSLRIGASITVGSCLLNEILNKLEKNHAEIKTNVTINNTEVLQRLLLNSELDVAIVEGIVEHKDLITKPIQTDKLILVVGKGHKFYDVEEISIQDLNGEDIISREEGSGSKKIFDNILKSNQIAVNIKWSSTDTEAIKNAVIECRGLAVLSSMVVEKELKKGTLKKVSLKEVTMFREILVVYHKNKFISESLMAFLNGV